MAGIITIFVLYDKKLSSDMAQISKYINSSNHKICSYDQISKIIVDLVSNTVDNKE